MDEHQVSKSPWEKVLTLEENGLIVEVSRARVVPARYSLFVGMRYPNGRILPYIDLKTHASGLNKPELAFNYAVLLGQMIVKAQEYIEAEMLSAWDLWLERQQSREQTRSQIAGAPSFVRAVGKTARDKAKRQHRKE